LIAPDGIASARSDAVAVRSGLLVRSSRPNPLRQWSKDSPAIGRDPAFALILGRPHRNHEVLHQKGFVTLEARPRRNLGRDHFLYNDDLRRDLAPAASLLFFSGFRWLGTFVHAARFDIGATLQAFQTGNFFALFGDRPRQCGDGLLQCADGLLQCGDFTE
jgi:hypothetical protein